MSDTSSNAGLAEDWTDLAEDRTLLANERTFSGWAQTVMAVIRMGVGFIDPQTSARYGAASCSIDPVLRR